MSLEDLKEIKEDVKELRKTVGEIHITMARNTASLEVHEKRTSLAEDRIKSLEYWTLGVLASAILGLTSYLIFK